MICLIAVTFVILYHGWLGYILLVLYYIMGGYLSYIIAMQGYQDTLGTGGEV